MIRISASRLKTLQECSLRFWYSEILRLPQKTHSRTQQGSCVHRIFELLMAPKRRTRLVEILTHPTGDLRELASGWAAHTLPRYIRLYDHFHGISPYEMDEMLDMLRVAFLGIRPYFTNPETGALVMPPVYHNERYFKFELGDGSVMSGVIDLLLIWPGERAIVIDLKSQRQKFVRADLPSNIQAAIYQLAVRHEFGTVPAVEFILLRHAPTKRNPQLHIQRVEPHTEDVLNGLSEYLKDMHQTLNDFTLEEALANPSKDEGFCSRVCPYLRPFTYWATVPASDPTIQTPLKTHLDKPPQDPYHEGKPDTVIVERRHDGCLARWSQG